MCPSFGRSIWSWWDAECVRLVGTSHMSASKSGSISTLFFGPEQRPNGSTPRWVQASDSAYLITAQMLLQLLFSRSPDRQARTRRILIAPPVNKLVSIVENLWGATVQCCIFTQFVGSTESKLLFSKSVMSTYSVMSCSST
jgi:hypothetical protein